MFNSSDEDDDDEDEDVLDMDDREKFKKGVAIHIAAVQPK